jgi:hypothetical protein
MIHRWKVMNTMATGIVMSSEAEALEQLAIPRGVVVERRQGPCRPAAVGVADHVNRDHPPFRPEPVRDPIPRGRRREIGVEEHHGAAVLRSRLDHRGATVRRGHLS